LINRKNFITDVSDKRFLIISMDGFEKSELMYPRSELLDAGAAVDVASAEMGEIRSMEDLEWSDSVSVDKTFDEVSAADYDALIIPGGVPNPDKMRNNETAVALVKAFRAAGKPIAAVCHAPWMLIEADILRGRKATSYPTLRTDLANAGAEVLDQEVVNDNDIITSRNPDDLPAFVNEIRRAVAA
jgi:protease I